MQKQCVLKHLSPSPQTFVLVQSLGCTFWAPVNADLLVIRPEQHGFTEAENMLGEQPLGWS